MASDVKQVVGVYRNGRVEIDAPPDWADGSTVTVTLNGHGARAANGQPPTQAGGADAVGPAGNDPPIRMMREEEWPTTPEGIEEHVRRMRSFEPVELSERDEAVIAAWRAEMKRFNVEAMRKQMGLDQ